METAARRLCGLHMEDPEQAMRKSLSVYNTITERGLIRWRAYLRTMAQCQSLGHEVDIRPCPACQKDP